MTVLRHLILQADIQCRRKELKVGSKGRLAGLRAERTSQKKISRAVRQGDLQSVHAAVSVSSEDGRKDDFHCSRRIHVPEPSCETQKAAPDSCQNRGNPYLSVPVFPGVIFGYSKLSIITLERAPWDLATAGRTRIVRGFRSSSEFRLLLEENAPCGHLEISHVSQAEALAGDDHRFVLGDGAMVELIKSTATRLGDAAEVVTGFCTGDDRRFLRAGCGDVPKADGYGMVNEDKICSRATSDGVPDPAEAYVSYVKGASKTRYLRRAGEWFVRWDRATVDYCRRSSRSRFQNSRCCFRTGVWIPMVKAGQIRAFLMKDSVFDQSVTGIFPRDEGRLLYILALMNSDAVCEMARIINPTANNSACYIRLLPYVEPSGHELDAISGRVERLLEEFRRGNSEACQMLHGQLNDAIRRICFPKTALNIRRRGCGMSYGV